MQINSQGIRSDMVGINSRDLRAEIKAAPSNASPAAGSTEGEENIDKRLAKYVAINQQLLLILYVLAEVSRAASQESSDTSRILVGYIGESQRINGVVTLLREIETVLESSIGIEYSSNIITVPSIGVLAGVYDVASTSQKMNFQRIYDWSVKLQANGLNYGPVSPAGSAVKSKKILYKTITAAYKALSLNEIKTYRSYEEEKQSINAAEQEGAQAKGQTNISAVYQMQDDYSQMIGTLKNAIMTLVRFK